MLDRFLYDIYLSNLTTIMIAIPVLVVVWSVIGAVFYKRMRIVGAILTVLSVAVILYMTVFSRHDKDVVLDLIPFSSFQRAKEQPEMYRSMLMNVFLFVPLGLSLPFVFGGATGKRILLTILIGFLLSASVEAIQYFASLGMAETDDVIFNTLGTAIGSCTYLLSLLWRRFYTKRLDKIRRKD